jgi:hypothetical protein
MSERGWVWLGMIAFSVFTLIGWLNNLYDLMWLWRWIDGL